jgi:DNA transposition AAA+ family ATPase
MHIELPETPDELFVETAQSKSVFTVCRFAQRKGLLALLIGPAGVGKTTALEAYTRSNSQTVMVTAFPGIPPICLLKRITGKLRYESGGDDATIIDNLIHRLKGKNTLIIIDEGHYVKLNILEQMRHIQDMTGIGLVLSGNFGLHEQMKGKEQVKYAHLSSRAAMKVRIDGSPLREELKAMMEKRELPTDRASLDFMIKKTEKPGHFRLLRNISELATEIAGLEGVPVEFSHLCEAEKLIME